MRNYLFAIIAILGVTSCKESPQPPPQIVVLERYSVTARVIMTKKYPGKEIYWAPVDAVLAWGPLLNPEKTKDITFSQYDRWYQWYPLPETNKREISENTANTHFVADTPASRELILSLEAGKTYFLEGALVKITMGKRTMQSSLSRTDTGSGACEVFLVKKATLVK